VYLVALLYPLWTLDREVAGIQGPATKTGCLLNGNPAINLEFDPWFSVPVSQRVWLCQKQDNDMTIFFYGCKTISLPAILVNRKKATDGGPPPRPTPQASPPPDTFHFHPLHR
jgi:hypothetical protein